MSKVIICYTKVTPRLVRRIQCLAERIPNLIVLELAGKEKVYPWWEGEYKVGSVRQVRLFEQRLGEI